MLCLSISTDRHTARFTPANGFFGLASFAFSVTGSDNSSFSSKVSVVVVPTGTDVREDPQNQKVQSRTALRSYAVTNTLCLINSRASAYAISDASGRLVKKNSLTQALVQNIGISDIENGVYILRLFSNDGNSVFRFLKKN